MMTRIRVACILVCIGVSACSQQSLPAWINSPVAPTQPSNFVKELVVDRQTVFGGSATQGTIRLEQSVAADTTIDLSTSDGAVSVPSSTSVSAGASTATFPITTGTVSSDTGVRITATLAGRPFVATLTVWHLGENDLWYERGATGGTHFTQANTMFAALCSGPTLNATAGSASFAFGALTSSNLRPGYYDDARTGVSNARPLLNILISSQFAVACEVGGTRGSFSIDELEVTRNTVRRFVATFEQHCASNGNFIRGGIRLTNVPPSSANLIGCD